METAQKTFPRRTVLPGGGRSVRGAVRLCWPGVDALPSEGPKRPLGSECLCPAQEAFWGGWPAEPLRESARGLRILEVRGQRGLTAS